MRTIQTNFTAGELSPRLTARVDFEKYANGLSALENYILHPHGGVTRRPGLRMVAEVKDSSKAVRLIPFIFSRTQAYMLEFGDQYIRFYMDGGQIEDGGSPYEVTTPYLEADLPAIKFCQSADVMYLVHPAYEPRKLSRTGHTSWTLETVTFTDQPSEWGTDNLPGTVSFYEQRLAFSGVPSHPQTIWLSKTNDYENFSVSDPLVEDDAATFTLVANEVNAVLWMQPSKKLIVGTVGGEWEFGGGGANDPVTPMSVNAMRHTTYGVADIQPVQVGNIVLYVQRNGRKLREFSYSLESDGYVARDMSLLAEHLTVGQSFTDATYQQDPDSIIWLVRSDGTLCGLTYLPEQKVYGWHRHTTQGDFECVANIPGESEDEVWVVVKRTVNGNTVRYVEFLDPQFAAEDTTTAFFVDSGLSYDGAATKTVTGLDHLEGETVQVLADGAVHPDCVVSSGQITLNRSASVIHAGLGYESYLKTLPLEVSLDEGGTVQGKIKRINQITLRLHNALGGFVGADGTFDEIYYRTSADVMGAPPAVFTGDKEMRPPSGHDKYGQIEVKQTQPLPFTLLALIFDVQMYGGV